MRNLVPLNRDNSEHTVVKYNSKILINVLKRAAAKNGLIVASRTIPKVKIMLYIEFSIRLLPKNHGNNIKMVAYHAIRNASTYERNNWGNKGS